VGIFILLLLTYGHSGSNTSLGKDKVVGFSLLFVSGISFGERGFNNWQPKTGVKMRACLFRKFL
jgi:hypothetical protein